MKKASISGATQLRLLSFIAVALLDGGGVKSGFLRIRDFGTRDSPVDALRNRAGVVGLPERMGCLGRRYRFRVSVSVVLPRVVKETGYLVTETGGTSPTPSSPRRYRPGRPGRPPRSTQLTRTVALRTLSAGV